MRIAIRLSDTEAMRIPVALVALAVLAAACGGDSSEAAPAETTSSTTEAPTAPAADPTTTHSEDPIELKASFRGVTEDVIRVGIVTFDYDLLTAVGFGFGNTNVDGAYEAALEAINDRGGVSGRTLEITNIVYDALGTIESDEACVRLTSDVEVFVVVGELDDNVTCYTELSDTAVIAAYGVYGEFLEQEEGEAPHVAVRMAHEDLASKFVDGLLTAGVLEGEKVGVVGAPGVTETNFLPVVDALREAGIDPFEALIRSVGDPLAALADGRLLTEVFRAEGVTFLINTLAAPVGLGIAGQIELPTALFPIISPTAMRAGNIDPGLAHGAYAVTQTDAYTVAQPEMADDPAIAACIDGIETRTGEVIPYALDAAVTNLDWALNACATADILEQALLNAGPDLTNESFQAGLEAIGDIDLPGFGSSHLGPGDIDAAELVTLVRFDADVGAWVEVP